MKTTGNYHADESAGSPVYLWPEPGLPWASEYLMTHPSAKPTTWQRVDIETDAMHPRFPRGCSVIAEAVPQGHPLVPGVYIWQTPRVPGHSYIGRLTQAPTPTQNFLLLSQDNRPEQLVCMLEWEHADFALCRVTFYNAVPGE